VVQLLGGASRRGRAAHDGSSRPGQHAAELVARVRTGDAPTAWTPVSVGAVDASQPRDFTQSGAANRYGTPNLYFWENAIAGGVSGLDTDGLVLLSSAGVELRTAQGVTRPGWPVPAPFYTLLATAQVVAGGDEETILCNTHLRALDSAGSSPTTWVDADLNGRCWGLTLADVNGDDLEEILVLIRHWNAAPTPSERVGNFLEAYTLAGTRLADTNALWPIDVPFIRRGDGYLISPELHRQVTLGDVDADGAPEVLQLQWALPWTEGWWVPNARVEVLDLP